MENRSYALLTGLFTILLGVALALAFAWFRGDTREYNEYLVVSKLPASGLYSQASVRYRGVEVGKVTEIGLDQKDPTTILIRILVEGSVPITRGTFAQFGTQGLTGIAHVHLDDDHSNPAPLRPTGAGPARNALRGSALDDLAESSKVLLRQATSLLERMNAIASEDNQLRLERTLQNFEQASARLDPALAAIPEVAERARRMLGEDNQESIRRSLSNLAEATDAIKPFAEDSRQVMANMRALSEKLDQISTEISVEVSDRTLPKINELVDQLDRDSRDFRRLVLQIEREPQSLVFGRRPVQPGPGEPGFNAGRK